MRLGIIGLPNSGKTTIFNALTGSDYPAEPFSSGQLEVHTAVVSVPDVRIDHLSSVFKPKKTIYTTVTYTDIGGLDKGIGEGLSGPMRNELQQVDGFLHVIRAFEDEAVPHSQETVDPIRDLEIIDGEFLLLDMIAVENRLARLAEDRQKGKTENRQQTMAETALFERLHAHLETEQPLRDMDDLTADEIKSLRGYGFLTLKPVLVIFNVGDNGADPAANLVYDHHQSLAVTLQGKLESEIAQLDDPDDVAMFLAEYNIEQPSRERVLQLSYDLLGIQSFFTYGEDEVRAWPLRKGGTAVEAAGTIHTDLARGFIRAEVIPYKDFVEFGSSLAEVKAHGKMRLEGKDYLVEDGDMIVIRFNI
jgi:GTP-binding protein YchF